MDVNDAELLALAGDDSSDEGNTLAPSATGNTASPLPPTNKPQSSAKDSSAGLKRSSLNTSTKTAGGRTQMTSTADSEEEGEA